MQSVAHILPGPRDAWHATLTLRWEGPRWQAEHL